MNEDKLKIYVDFATKLIDDYFTNSRKVVIEEMLDKIGDRFFSSPCCSKLDFSTPGHPCSPGGLIVHSIEVVKLAFKMYKTLNVEELEVPKQSLVLASLFHDLGKIGTLEQSYYITQNDSWRRNKLGELYTINKELDDSLTHAQRSVRLLSQFGIELTNLEHDAILLHDGIFVTENQNRESMYTRNKLLRIIHFADMWLTFVEGRNA